VSKSAATRSSDEGVVVAVAVERAAGLFGQHLQRRLEIGRLHLIDERHPRRVALHVGAGRGPQAGGVDGVEGDAVGVGLGGELLEPAALVELLGLEQAHLLTELLLQDVVQILAGAHLQAVADVEQRLASRQSGERAHEVLERRDRELQVVGGRLRVRTHAAGHLRVRLRVVDLAHQVAALAVGGDARGGHLLELKGGLGDRLRVGGERPPDVELAVVGDQHRAVALVDLLRHESAHVAQHAVAVEGPQVEVVDVDHQMQPLVVGHLRQLVRHSGPGRLAGCRRHDGGVGHAGLAAVDGVEVGDRHHLLVLDHLEIAGLQAAHALALLVGHEDVDVHHADADRLEVLLPLLSLGRLRRLGREVRLRSGRRQTDTGQGGENDDGQAAESMQVLPFSKRL
jgi:hypothetical protein